MAKMAQAVHSKVTHNNVGNGGNPFELVMLAVCLLIALGAIMLLAAGIV